MEDSAFHHSAENLRPAPYSGWPEEATQDQQKIKDE